MLCESLMHSCLVVKARSAIPVGRSKVACRHQERALCCCSKRLIGSGYDFVSSPCGLVTIFGQS
jgi:hypothetical protein